MAPFGKLVTAFFASVTPRTASIPLTWVHCFLPPSSSPFSADADGRIAGLYSRWYQDTTFAVTVMNVISIAEKRTVWRSFRRELSIGSLRRAFADDLLITAGHRLIGFLLHVVQPGLDTTQVIFECISAFSTAVGLSLGITADLNTASQMGHHSDHVHWPGRHPDLVCSVVQKGENT